MTTYYININFKGVIEKGKTMKLLIFSVVGN